MKNLNSGGNKSGKLSEKNFNKICKDVFNKPCPFTTSGKHKKTWKHLTKKEVVK